MDNQVLELLKKRMYLKDGESNWSDISNRVAKSISSIEKDKTIREKVYKEIYDAMDKQEFIFSSPVLLNAKKDHTGQLSSCFVLDTKDNIESICQTDAQITKIFQKNGGAGMDLSVLRPAKDIVEISNGYAGGVCAFAEKYNATTDVMTRNNMSKRGALKINLACWHPDIFEFIHCKDVDGNLSFMNISVSFTDDFMNSVKNDNDWCLEFPDYSICKEKYNEEWDGNLQKWKRKGLPVKLYKTVKARELWNEFIYCSWNKGEPGCNFQDTMNKDNPNKHLEEMVYTNPCSEFSNIPFSSCLAGDTIISTINGIKKLEDLEKYDMICDTENIYRNHGGLVCRGIKPTYKLTLRFGNSIEATDDHIFLTNNGWKKLKDLNIEHDKIKINSGHTYLNTEENDDLYEMFGWMHGDGWFTNDVVGISFNNEDGDFEIKERIFGEFKKYFDIDNIKPLKDDSVSFQLQSDKKINIKKCLDLGFYPGLAKEKQIPSTFYNWDFVKQKSFLRGLFSADGGVYGRTKRDINYQSSSEQLIIDLQKIFSSLGIQGRICQNTSVERKTQQYRFTISKNSAKKFMKLIGFNNSKKNNKFGTTKAKKTYKDYEFLNIKSIEYCGEKKVYDILEVNKSNSFFANGIGVHNCNLGSVNLNNLVENNKFNWNRLKEISYKCVLWFDNMIEINNLPLQKLTEITKGIRPIGYGFMGLADAMYKLGIRYNSKDGFDFAEKIIKIMKEETFKASKDLANERGNYPLWEGSEWQKNGVSIRNSNLLCIAPTGSISFFANTSGGLEPNFALTYTRKTSTGEYYTILNSIFEEKLKELGIHSEGLIQKIAENNGSCQGIEEIPKEIQNIFVIASDLTPKEHVDMLVTIQNHIDMSTSKSINFLNNATPQDIYDVYMYAWENGVKGCTIYRDGCRENQTLSVTKQSEEKTERYDLNRGDILCVNDDLLSAKRTIINGCGKFYLHVDFDEYSGEVLETFLNPSGCGGCERNLQFISRLMSVLLRAGVSLDYIIDQANSIRPCNAYTERTRKFGDTSKGTSCPSAIGNALKELEQKIKERCFCEDDIFDCDTSLSIKYSICPECNEESLISEGGCQTCNICGFSFCG